MECPKCKEPMGGRGVNYRCEKCNEKYRVRFFCEKCGSQPEEISSCGSVGYFCKKCNELKSRQGMNKEILHS